MKYTILFEGIGTHWQIDFEADDRFDKDKLLKQIKSLVESFDKTYSRFRDDSLIFKISKKKGIYKFPNDSRKLFNIYKKLYEISNGTMTPLIGQVMNDVGYDKNYSLVPKKLNHPPKWEETMDFKYPYLNVKRPFILDFGAAGKGYLVDLIANFLIKNYIKEFCIDGSGDIFYKTDNKKKIRIGLENPNNMSEVIGTVELLNGSICGSAGNRRRWGKFNHIINPHTLKPSYEIKATWVKADEAIIADGLATCLFFVSPEKFQDDFNFSYLIIYKDMTYKMSKNFNAKLFIEAI